MLLYRLPEAQLAKMSIPFLLDPNSEGGLGMTTEQIGFTQGTVGIIGLTLGGILGGMAVARHGLKQWLWYMVWAISLPDLVYVFLSYFPETNLLWINVCILSNSLAMDLGSRHTCCISFIFPGEVTVRHTTPSVQHLWHWA